MYHLFGMQECLEIVERFANPESGALAIDGQALAPLKVLYLQALARIQPKITLATQLGPGIVVDPVTCAELAASFVEPATSNDILPPIDDRIIREELARYPRERCEHHGLRLAQSHRGLLQKDPSLAAVFALVINRLFVFPIPGNQGGSTHRAVGVVWANPCEHADDVDLQELLVHELTHNLLFIDALVHGHYRSEAALNEIYARSAIRRSERPLYCVVHSLAVGLEILGFRHRHGLFGREAKLHPPSQKLLADCHDTLDSIRAIPNIEALIRPRLGSILLHCDEVLNEMECQQNAATPSVAGPVHVEALSA